MSTPARKAQLINELREQRDAQSRALERLSSNDATQPIFRREREQVSVCEQHLANPQAWEQRRT
ncbi:MAG: hypothetical protein O3B31_03650 [Chloroflexi bacterium]|nr:hypothetical protein [Chloroflexota bacterium]MDA1002433.1 hypothetical protein [Chloroflexota bacterium]MQC27592.1 hypothetical protein [Chloroflexota bacterium]